MYLRKVLQQKFREKKCTGPIGYNETSLLKYHKELTLNILNLYS